MICIEQYIDRERFNKARKQKYDFLYADKPRKILKRNFIANI